MAGLPEITLLAAAVAAQVPQDQMEHPLLALAEMAATAPRQQLADHR